MPERPKRRKNNKNKRKNKNGRVDTTNTGTCDIKSADDTCFIENKDDKEKESAVETTPVNDGTVNNLVEETPSNIEIKSDEPKERNKGTVEIHKIDVATIENRSVTEGIQESLIELNSYVVESPDQPMKKVKLSNGKKSKSVDDDESLKIVEITEESSSLLENKNDTKTAKDSVLLFDVDSDIKWEKTSDFESNLPKIEEPLTGTLSITTIPLETARCEQAKLLSPEEELSLRNYLQSLNLATNPSTSLEIKTEIEQIIDSEIKQRLRKKGLAEEVFTQRLGPPRMLDVIDEEGSGDSSFQSRRHSYLSDKKSDNDDLEDDVFEKPNTGSCVSNRKDIKLQKTFMKKTSFQQIPQKCVLVGAKLKEPDVTEARGDWTFETVEKMTGAEVVYLTDSSSSTSSIYDVGEDVENEEDTDVSVRMITPTIEVTDTENLLKKTFETKDTTDIVKKEAFDSNNKFSIMDNTLHEVVVDSTDNIKTNLTVKDIDDTEKDLRNDSAHINIKTGVINYVTDYDLEMKVLKCELNDAINNLIKEVSDSESVNENSKDIFTRQDSSSSVSSSQCTAIYNPNSSLNDVPNSTNDDVTQINQELKDSITKSHVSEVIEHVAENFAGNPIHFRDNVKQPYKLRDICVNKISSLPYGLKILEELADVSLRLQNINSAGSELIEIINASTINKTNKNRRVEFTSNPTSVYNEEKISNIAINPPPPRPPPPPPLQPRNSSLKKSHDNQQLPEVPINKPPYVCLSPSQKMLMERTNTVITDDNKTNVKEVSTKISETIEDKNKSMYWAENAPIKPLKSNTGSRLMALICDPAMSKNITSSLQSFEEKQNNLTNKKVQNRIIESSLPTKKYIDQDFATNFQKNSFKPVPPPKPKFMSSYESDENSDFAEGSFKSMRKERKFFHFSTGNLSKEIEDDVSTIQKMHKNYMNVKEQTAAVNAPRRPSLPKDLCDQQMEYIRQKEKEVEAEIRRLEAEKQSKPIVRKGPRAPMIVEKDTNSELMPDIRHKSYAKGMLWNTVTPEKEKSKLSSLFSSSQEELLREKMYSEYISEIAEREQRKQHKVIKITNTPKTDYRSISKSMSALDVLDSKVNNRIEEEFISKAKERWHKLGIMDPESEDERYNKKNVYREPKVIEHKIKVIDGGEEKDVKKLPSHLQEFVTFTAKDKEQKSSSPGESGCEEKPTHVVILCAVMLLVLAIGRYLMRLWRNV